MLLFILCFLHLFFSSVFFFNFTSFVAAESPWICDKIRKRKILCKFCFLRSNLQFDCENWTAFNKEAEHRDNTLIAILINSIQSVNFPVDKILCCCIVLQWIVAYDNRTYFVINDFFVRFTHGQKCKYWIMCDKLYS